MREVSLLDVRNFLIGNFKYYYDKFVRYPDFVQEQLQYRYDKCKKDCIPNNACIGCGCPPIKKHFLTKSCNSDRFPDLMSKEDWEKFKKKLDAEGV